MAKIDYAILDNIINDTLKVVESSQEQLFSIADSAREDYQAVSDELQAIKEQVLKRIQEVDQLEREDRRTRLHLMEISKDFSAYSQDEIKAAYDNAKTVQSKLLLAREREKILREQRDALERRLKNIKQMVDRAEELVSNVGMAMNLLRGDLQRVNAEMRNMENRELHAMSIISAQEEERKRVARDIHDGPAQLLANVVLRLEVTERVMESDLERARGEVRKLKDLVRQSLQDVRKIIFDLRPMALDDLGLLPALKGFVNSFEDRTGIGTNLQILGDERRFNPNWEVAIFRLIQESLNNVAKHSQASFVDVKLELGTTQVIAVVSDDGIGFDVEKAGKVNQERFGLTSMKERVDILGGSFEITSVVNRGTRVVFKLPLPDGDESNG